MSNKTASIEITQETAARIWDMYDRYYFGVFQKAGLAKDEDEERAMIDAIGKIIIELREVSKRYIENEEKL